MKRTTLAEYDPSIFVIGKEMQYNPTVPEFIYNEQECSKFIQIIGQVSMRQNLPKLHPNKATSKPIILGKRAADMSDRGLNDSQKD